MRICIIAEGCYPYIVGGVSSWVHSLIKSFPQQEFVIMAIIANRSLRGKYVYELPKNVTEIHELYLEDKDWCKNKRHKKRIDKKEYRALRSLVLNQKIEWETLFDLFQKENFSLNDLLMGEDFLNAVRDCYELNYSQIVFSDFLWMMRSIYLPLFFTLKMKTPKADIYHCVSTGYAGVLGSLAQYVHGGRLLISEHGIYTREREEELIKAKWVQGIYKNIWIEQFKKMSKLSYEKASLVTSLYEHARELQIELGCPVEKTMITPNGISVEQFQELTGKPAQEEKLINVGAVLRVTPIKDIKTLIQAFGFAKERESNLKLWIMGPWEEDQEYAQECFELVENMGLSDVIFTGRVDVREYYGRMDMTILTSISEGQPLTILESFAAHKPVIATDVGNCKGLVLGEGDGFGEAGIITHIMNVEEIAQAIVTLARDEAMRLSMGENGYQRVNSGYRIETMQDTYAHIYQNFADSMWLVWNGEKAVQSAEEIADYDQRLVAPALDLVYQEELLQDDDFEYMWDDADPDYTWDLAGSNAMMAERKRRQELKEDDFDYIVEEDDYDYLIEEDSYDYIIEDDGYDYIVENDDFDYIVEDDVLDHFGNKSDPGLAWT